MAFTRTTIPYFSVVNPLYAGAEVRLFTVDDDGNPTATYATIYDAPVGTGTLQNPQILDSNGRWKHPPYIDEDVYIIVDGVGLPEHDVGLIQYNEAASFHVDTFTGDGATTTFALARDVFTEAGVRVEIDGVSQEPVAAYTIDDQDHRTLTFAEAPPEDATIVVVHQASPASLRVPGDGTVDADTITDGMADHQLILEKIQVLQEGAGAVYRSVRGKLIETISVKDFGAKGDGVTPDYTAFQRAQQRATTLGGATIKVPFGTYLWGGAGGEIVNGSSIRVRSNTAWVGEGKPVILVRARESGGAARGMVIEDADNVVIEGFVMDGCERVQMAIHMRGIVRNTYICDVDLINFVNFASTYGSQDYNPDTSYLENVTFERVTVSGMCGMIATGAGLNIFPRAQVNGLPISNNISFIDCTLDVTRTPGALLTATTNPRKPKWAPNTVYQVNNQVMANGNIYVCTGVTGSAMSAGVGTGPSGTGSGITDNEVTWAYQGAFETVTWCPNTAYSIGNTVISGSEVYTCVVAGTSGSSPTGGPTGTGTGLGKLVTGDGTVTWSHYGTYQSVVGVPIRYPDEWAENTVYEVGAYVRGVSENLVYRCTAPGTSAFGTGPSGVGATIADGTAEWTFVGALNRVVTEDLIDGGIGYSPGTLAVRHHPRNPDIAPEFQLTIVDGVITKLAVTNKGAGVTDNVQITFQDPTYEGRGATIADSRDARFHGIQCLKLNNAKSVLYRGCRLRGSPNYALKIGNGSQNVFVTETTVTYTARGISCNGSNGIRRPITLTPDDIDDVNDTITVEGHDFVVGQALAFEDPDEGVLPGGISPELPYYVTAVVGDVITLSENPGGSTIDILDQGQGIFSIGRITANPMLAVHFIGVTIQKDGVLNGDNTGFVFRGSMRGSSISAFWIEGNLVFQPIRPQDIMSGIVISNGTLYDSNLIVETRPNTTDIITPITDLRMKDVIFRSDPLSTVGNGRLLNNNTLRTINNSRFEGLTFIDTNVPCVWNIGVNNSFDRIIARSANKFVTSDAAIIRDDGYRTVLGEVANYDPAPTATAWASSDAISTGEYRYTAWSAWVGSTAYNVGDEVVRSQNVYRCITAGTTAGTGGPSGRAQLIVDGTAEWRWVATARKRIYRAIVGGTSGTQTPTQEGNDVVVDGTVRWAYEGANDMAYWVHKTAGRGLYIERVAGVVNNSMGFNFVNFDAVGAECPAGPIAIGTDVFTLSASGGHRRIFVAAEDYYVAGILWRVNLALSADATTTEVRVGVTDLAGSNATNGFASWVPPASTAAAAATTNNTPTDGVVVFANSSGSQSLSKRLLQRHEILSLGCTGSKAGAGSVVPTVYLVPHQPQVNL